jgi:hypothetical protein
MAMGEDYGRKGGRGVTEFFTILRDVYFKIQSEQLLLEMTS